VYWIVWVLWITRTPPAKFKSFDIVVRDVSPYLRCVGVWFIEPLDVIPLLVDKLDGSVWFRLFKSPIGSSLGVPWVFYPKGVSDYVVWEIWFVSSFDSGKLPLFCGPTKCYGSRLVDPTPTLSRGAVSVAYRLFTPTRGTKNFLCTLAHTFSA
jgi:hypothetical protein